MQSALIEVLEDMTGSSPWNLKLGPDHSSGNYDNYNHHRSSTHVDKHSKIWWWNPMGRSDHNRQHPAVSYCSTSLEKNRPQIDGTSFFSLLYYNPTLFFITQLHIMQNLTSMGIPIFVALSW